MQLGRWQAGDPLGRRDESGRALSAFRRRRSKLRAARPVSDRPRDEALGRLMRGSHPYRAWPVHCERVREAGRPRRSMARGLALILLLPARSGVVVEQQTPGGYISLTRRAVMRTPTPSTPVRSRVLGPVPRGHGTGRRETGPLRPPARLCLLCALGRAPAPWRRPSLSRARAAL